jgi:hypothetical protein
MSHKIPDDVLAEIHRVCGLDALGADSAQEAAFYKSAVNTPMSGKDREVARRQIEQDDIESAKQYRAQQARSAEYEKARRPVTSSSSSSSQASVYPAAAYTAAQSCHANGMTIWHYLFFAVLIALIFFAPRVFAFMKSKVVARKNVEPSTGADIGTEHNLALYTGHK